MREPISRDSAPPRELAEATRRLDRALDLLAAAYMAKGPASTLTGTPDEAAYAALESDRARLAAELDVARARESELESAAAAASQALGRAAVEVRAALDEGGGGDDDAEQASKPDGDGFNEEAA